MSSRFITCRMAEASTDVSVVDVYDYASTIGKEFEGLIENYGVDSVSSLMPKVIRVLEHLENLANKIERENSEVNDLKYAVERLEREKAERASERARYEQELEQIEEQWRGEAKDLLQMVAKLQSENRKLSSALTEKEKRAVKQESREEEIKLMTKLKETVDKQRDQMRVMKREITQKQAHEEALQAQLERLAKLNTELRRKNNVTSRQAKHLHEEKADLQSQLQDKEQQISKIKDRMRDDSSDLSPGSPSDILPEDWDKLRDRLTREGKMVIDMKDPNRPRFTLKELRDVLLERNELKSKLIEVEEELQVYKTDSQDYDFDAPVQGPINREPDEKVNPSKEDSGIRKFFRMIGFNNSNKKSTKNRRSSVTTNSSACSSKSNSPQAVRKTRAATIAQDTLDPNLVNLLQTSLPEATPI